MWDTPIDSRRIAIEFDLSFGNNLPIFAASSCSTLRNSMFRHLAFELIVFLYTMVSRFRLKN